MGGGVGAGGDVVGAGGGGGVVGVVGGGVCGVVGGAGGVGEAAGEYFYKCLQDMAGGCQCNRMNSERC